MMWMEKKRPQKKKKQTEAFLYLILSLPTAEDTAQNLWSVPII